MSNYRFFSDTSFEFFLDEIEQLGADETVITADHNLLTVSLDDDWEQEQDPYDLDYKVTLWSGEKVW